MFQGLGPEPTFLTSGSKIIRTYKRRPQECQLIEGVGERCRLCLGRQPTVPIYGANDTHSSLATRIMMCVGLEMTKDVYLPNCICAECYKQIENCYTFRKICEVAYQKLKMHLQAVKMKEANELNDEAKTQTSLLSKCLQNGDQDNSNTNELDNNIQNKSTEIIKTELENKANVEHINKDYVDLVLVVNESSVQLLDQYQIEQSRVMELCGSTEEQNVLKLNSQPLEQAVTNNGEFTKETQPIGVKLKTEVPLPPQLVHVQETPEITELTIQDSISGPSDFSIQDSISTFITTQLMDSEMLTVQDGDRIVMNEDVNMVLELVALDGSLVTLSLTEEDEQDEHGESKDPPVIYESDSKAGTAGILTIKRYSDKTKRKAKCNQSPTCGICGRQFAQRGALERHRSVHTGARPHRCRHCGRGFGQRSVCKRHELTHAETRPFPCGSCGKSFTQRGALLLHQRSHQPPAQRALLLHACALCPKLFLYASGLSRHIKMHDGLKFTCENCSRTFSDKSSLRRHMAKHAGKPTAATPAT